MASIRDLKKDINFVLGDIIDAVYIWEAINPKEDHRIAMAFFCLGQLLNGRVRINNFQTVNTSFAKFLFIMKKIGATFEIKKHN